MINQIPDVIVVDLDGTFLNSRCEVSTRNYQAVIRCRDYDIPFIIATSRPMRTVQRFLGNSLMAQVSSVMLNGALSIGTPPLSGQFYRRLSRDIVGGILEIVNADFPGIALTLEIDGVRFAVNASYNEQKLWKMYSATPDMVVSIDEAANHPVLKIAINGRGQILQGLQSKLEEFIGDNGVIIPALQDTFLNIMSAFTSKESAVEQLLAPHRRSLKNGWAFGDDVPDVGLLSLAGVSVAMANAESSVKAIAKYETGHHDSDGVADFIERHLTGGAQ